MGMKLFRDIVGKTIPDRPFVLLNDELGDTPGIAIFDNRIFIELSSIPSLQSCVVIEPTTSELFIVTRLAIVTWLRAISIEENINY